MNSAKKEVKKPHQDQRSEDPNKEEVIEYPEKDAYGSEYYEVDRIIDMKRENKQSLYYVSFPKKNVL